MDHAAEDGFGKLEEEPGPVFRKQEVFHKQEGRREQELATEASNEVVGPSLDPLDWSSFRVQAHRMLDDMIDYTETIRQRPVWQPIPSDPSDAPVAPATPTARSNSPEPPDAPEFPVGPGLAGRRAWFRRPLPAAPTDLGAVHAEFMEHVLPYALGNVHPGFLGWVHGGGTPVGMLAAMLAAGLNANLGGRDHAPIEVERQVTEWMRQLFGFPQGASGLCVTGTSTANLLAVLIARDAALGCGGEHFKACNNGWKQSPGLKNFEGYKYDHAPKDFDNIDTGSDGIRTGSDGGKGSGGFNVRREGVAAQTQRLTAYGSTATHGCVAKAMDIAGLGSDGLRRIGTDARGRIEVAALEAAIAQDREDGLTPFLVVATAGTVDTGAIDDLAAVANLCARQGLWFHVDGACAALAMLSAELAPRLKGIERADSIAFDFHKWAQVPYDAGFLLVREGELHRQAFSASAAYLRRETRGMAAGGPWPCDLGIELSRGFPALKIWFSFKVHGTAALGASMARSCALARFLAERIAETPELELLAPVELNIVCFRYRTVCSERGDADWDTKVDAHGNAKLDARRNRVDAHRNRVNAQIAVALQEAGAVAPSTTSLDGRLALRAAIVNHRTGAAEIETLIEQTLLFGRELEAAACVAEAAAVQAPAQSPWQRELRALEAQLERQPDSTDLLFFRARLLERMGRIAEARQRYRALLERDPAHLAALNNLGNLLLSTRIAEETEQARRLFLHAVTAAPTHLASQANLGNLLIKQGELAAARAHFHAALHIDPGYRPAHAGLSFILGDLGDADGATRHRRQAFADRAIVIAAYRGEQPPIRVLELVSTTGGNIRTDELLSDRVFQRILVATEFYIPGTVLPPHDLVLNAVGDADSAGRALAGALAVVADTRAPVLNAPAAVLATGRCAIAERLAGIPGVKTARTLTLRRAQLRGADAAGLLSGRGLCFPLLLRSPGFHGGDHFLRVEAAAELAAAVDALPGEELLVLEYLDARGADGLARKYRVMMVDGRLYPLHAAISADWKIHYFSADMAASAANRGEDAAFLADMAGVLGSQAMAALEHIERTLGLDYGGIDFGLNAAGEVLLFEANATMAIVLPDKDPRWDYRRAPVEAVYKAVWSMLQTRRTPCPWTSLDGRARSSDTSALDGLDPSSHAQGAPT